MILLAFLLFLYRGCLLRINLLFNLFWNLLFSLFIFYFLFRLFFFSFCFNCLFFSIFLISLFLIYFNNLHWLCLCGFALYSLFLRLFWFFIFFLFIFSHVDFCNFFQYLILLSPMLHRQCNDWRYLLFLIVLNFYFNQYIRRT